MKSFYQIESLDEINGLVREGRYTFSSQIVSKRYIALTSHFDEYAKTHLKTISGCIFATPFVFVFKDNFVLADGFRRLILQYSEVGLIDEWFKTFEQKETSMRHFFTKNVDAEVYTYVALKMERVQGVFYFLIIGLSIACLVFSIENLFSFVCKKSVTEKTNKNSLP